MTHAEATQLVLGKNNRMDRKVANNTRARILPDGSVAFQLHSTDVVTIHDDDSATLRTGGWNSPTTKERINRYSPVYVKQINWEWYLSDGTPFYEGMKVYA
tara:strand:+ start:25 stop:327 length:303 start_codon:yes stop_codon:yes gene_type:complete